MVEYSPTGQADGDPIRRDRSQRTCSIVAMHLADGKSMRAVTASMLLMIALAACTTAAPPAGSRPPSAGSPSGTPQDTSVPHSADSSGNASALGVYPIPASCASIPLGQMAKIPGDGLSAEAPLGVLYAGNNKLLWRMDHLAPLELGGRRLDGPAPPPRLVSAASAMQGGALIGTSSTVSFPAAGCWHVHATAGAQTLDAILYVYPQACRPEYRRDTCAAGN